jgi:hypothetical protein
MVLRIRMARSCRFDERPSRLSSPKTWYRVVMKSYFVTETRDGYLNTPIFEVVIPLK